MCSTLPNLASIANSIISNRWLYSHGQKEKAIGVLARLMDCPVEDSVVTSFVAEIEQAISVEEYQPKFTFTSLFSDTTQMKNPRRILLCFLIQFFQQFTGINVIAFYGRHSAFC